MLRKIQNNCAKKLIFPNCRQHLPTIYWSHYTAHYTAKQQQFHSHQCGPFEFRNNGDYTVKTKFAKIFLGKISENTEIFLGKISENTKMFK